MKKYKIVLGGRGAETYIFKITPEQKQKFIDGEVEKDKMDMDAICEVLEVGYITDTDETYSGPYTQNDNFVIEVYDEKETLVWDSYEMETDWDFNEEAKWECDDCYESVADDENVFIAEDYTKGNYREYFIEIEEDFDPNKLLPIVTEIGERIELITGLIYDGKKIEDFEWGDTWSKGLYFYVN